MIKIEIFKDGVKSYELFSGIDTFVHVMMSIIGELVETKYHVKSVSSKTPDEDTLEGWFKFECTEGLVEIRTKLA